MQHKLATWAAADQTRRFDRLLRLITDRNWLAEAARIVLASKGANTPGLDGMDKRRLAVDLERHLDRLRVALLDGTYRPTPVKRIHIPKANGKLRPLGIPILLDRIVQRAMLMAMEPIWESDFHSGSYGFRPERSVHHAVRTVRMQLQDGSDSKGRWIIEGDLASYFDTVHHRLLLKCVRRRIRDLRFIDLLWRILKAGHVDRGLFFAASEGVPQGGVMAPRTQKITLRSRQSSVRTAGCRAVARCHGQRDAVPDDNLVVADEDFLDEKPQDALAFQYVESPRRRSETRKERG